MPQPIQVPQSPNGNGQQLSESRIEERLTDSLVVGYRPTLPIQSMWNTDGTPYFYVLRDIEIMMTDPHVIHCMDMYQAGLATAEVEVTKASSADVRDFAAAEFKRFWQRSLHKIQGSYQYGWVGGEVGYAVERGLLVFDQLQDFSPRDTFVLTHEKEYVGVRVKQVEGDSTGVVDLWGAGRTPGYWIKMADGQYIWLNNEKYDIPAKGFWFAHQARYNQWYGKSQLHGAWRPWRRKSGPDGAESVVDMAVYRYGVGGPVGRFPPEDSLPRTSDLPGTMPKNNRDVMRMLIEQAKAGVSIALSSAKYPNTNDYKWDIDFPERVIEVDPLINYIKYLKDEIAFGIGVPPEIMQAAMTGSGYSGRAIPLQQFLVGQQRNAEAIAHEWKKQMGDALVKWNFGRDAWFEMEVKSLLATQGQANQGQQPQPGAQPGAQPGGQPGGDMSKLLQGAGAGAGGGQPQQMSTVANFGLAVPDEKELSRQDVAEILADQHHNKEAGKYAEELSERWVSSERFVRRLVPIDFAEEVGDPVKEGDRSESTGPLIVDLNPRDKSQVIIVDGKHRHHEAVLNGVRVIDAYVGEQALPLLENPAHITIGSKDEPHETAQVPETFSCLADKARTILSISPWPVDAVSLAASKTEQRLELTVDEEGQEQALSLLRQALDSVNVTDKRLSSAAVAQLYLGVDALSVQEAETFSLSNELWGVYTLKIGPLKGRAVGWKNTQTGEIVYGERPQSP